MRVLLVDDEKELVTTLAERLGFRGIEADWATDAEDALSVVQNTTYDLAVLDIKMPGIDGFELKRRIQEKVPQMKFIFLTGHGSENYYQIASAETGEEFYLVKPVNIDKLMEKMYEALSKKGDL